MQEEKSRRDSSKIMDDPMKEREPDPECLNGGTKHYPSYRASPMGFNRIANNASPTEEDDLFNAEKEVNWELPEETEEIKKLKKIYPEVPVTQDEFNEWCEPWNFALVFTVLGRKFNVYTLKDLLSKMWGFSTFELIDMPNNYFLVRLSENDHWCSQYRKILYEGPWVIRQHCVLVQQWSPYFDPYHNSLGRVATWIRIPDVPMHYYNRHCIAQLGDRIGRTLKVDMNTLKDLQTTNSKIERGKYVRMCVELNLQRKLVPRITVARSVFNIEYEGLGVICFECSHYGHRKEACLWKISSSNQATGQVSPSPATKPPMSASTSSRMTQENTFGIWMLAGKSNKARFSKPVELKSSHRHQGDQPKPRNEEMVFSQKTSFAAFEDMGEDDMVEHEVDSSKELTIDMSDTKALTLIGKEKKRTISDVKEL